MKETKQAGKESFILRTSYKKTDGWRGYREPVYAIVGANDTGEYSDSPCPSSVRKAELSAIRKALKAEGILVRQKVCETSNIFCVHVYLVAKPSEADRARQIVKEYLENNSTQLAYLVS